MAQAIAIDTKIAKDILLLLEELKREVVLLREKLEAEPSYGSRTWWEWSERRADEDIKARKLVRFDSVEEAIQWLNS